MTISKCRKQNHLKSAAKCDIVLYSDITKCSGGMAMPRIKHINADLLSDEELTHVSDMLDNAEQKMNEKLMEEIDRRKGGMVKSSSGLWVPFDADKPKS